MTSGTLLQIFSSSGADFFNLFNLSVSVLMRTLTACLIGNAENWIGCWNDASTIPLF